jgi:hypothetical protein
MRFNKITVSSCKTKGKRLVQTALRISWFLDFVQHLVFQIEYVSEKPPVLDIMHCKSKSANKCARLLVSIRYIFNPYICFSK